MKEYLMIFRNEKSDGAAAPSAEQMQAVMKQWQDWIQGIASKGKYGGTNRLLSEGKTIKPGNIISDGPYAEVKEMIGGYLIVKAGSLDEAMEMAKSCPNLLYGGNVEVRAVMSIDADHKSKHFLEPK
ncbi:MAG: YciI family protein [Bacteroidota bacterium]